MANGYTIYYLINMSISIFVSFIFVIILFRQFFKKRTIGTILLAICYFLINLAGIFQLVAKLIMINHSDEKIITGIFQQAYLLLGIVGLLFLYYFANRHILQDSDLVKSLTVISLSILISIVVGAITSEIVHQIENPIFHVANYDEILELSAVIPTPLLSFGIIIAIFSLIHVRIIIAIIRIRRGLEKKLTKFGFTFILLSVISLASATLVISLNALPFVKDSIIAILVLQNFRIFFSISGVVLGYLGWIMPDWLKRRIRGKSWIASQFSKEITPQIVPIASSNKSEQFVEVSEK